MQRLNGLPPSRCLAPDVFRAIDPAEREVCGFDMALPLRGVRLISDGWLGGMDLRVLHTLVWRTCVDDPSLLQERGTLAPSWIRIGWHGFYVSVRGEVADQELVRSALERLAGVVVVRGGNQRSPLLALEVSETALSGQLDVAIAAALLGVAGGRLFMDHFELQSLVADDACIMYRRLCDAVAIDEPVGLTLDAIVEFLSPASRPLRARDARARAVAAFSEVMALRRWRAQWSVGNVVTITRRAPTAPGLEDGVFPTF